MQVVASFSIRARTFSEKLSTLFGLVFLVGCENFGVRFHFYEGSAIGVSKFFATMCILAPFSIGTGPKIHEIPAELNFIFGILGVGLKSIIDVGRIIFISVNVMMAVLVLLLGFRFCGFLRTNLDGGAVHC